MIEYDEYDNEEDSQIGYNRVLLQQLKLNWHAEKNNSLSWRQTQYSLLCSYEIIRLITPGNPKLGTLHHLHYHWKK